MPLPVNKSKLRGERSRLSFDFTDLLDFGENLSSWNVTGEIILGVGEPAKDMIYPLQQTLGNVAVQYVVTGEPGCIYEFRCTALTTLGRTLVKEQTLAVLPSQTLFPPLLGVSYTSPPYPIEAVEFMDTSPFVSEGLLKVLYVFLDLPPLAMDSLAGVTLGTLRAPLIQYSMRVEAIDSLASFPSGTLRTVLIQYSMRAEAVDNFSTCVSGILDAILITTTMRTEALDSLAAPTGGTLS